MDEVTLADRVATATEMDGLTELRLKEINNLPAAWKAIKTD